MKTHLFKPGYAPPYRANTACGLTVSTTLLRERPSCDDCAAIVVEETIAILEDLAEMELRCQQSNAS